jgi:hydroxymethylpyrimidine pyrophosphatase-like HAD family hydrolase
MTEVQHRQIMERAYDAVRIEYGLHLLKKVNKDQWAVAFNGYYLYYNKIYTYDTLGRHIFHFINNFILNDYNKHQKILNKISKFALKNNIALRDAVRIKKIKDTKTLVKRTVRRFIKSKIYSATPSVPKAV